MRVYNSQPCLRVPTCKVFESRIVPAKVEGDSVSTTNILETYDLTDKTAGSNIPDRESYSLEVHLRAGITPQMVDSKLLTPTSPDYVNYYASNLVQMLNTNTQTND